MTTTKIETEEKSVTINFDNGLELLMFKTNDKFPLMIQMKIKSKDHAVAYCDSVSSMAIKQFINNNFPSGF